MGIGNILKDFMHKIIHPPNDSWHYTYPAICILLVVITSIFYRRILRVLQCRNLWAVLALCVCFYSASGQTWNQIRKPQKYIEGKNGENNAYFSHVYKFQFEWESYIIAATYAGVVLGMILMIEAGGGVNKERRIRNTRLRRVLTTIGLIIFCVCCSMLLDYLRKKRWHVSGIFLLHIP
ncbi:hypothetical protein O0L34_g14720 [Tuta absoluta]|nr:hypothetical protein O0L34_g14720 [Tuta absoluta]